MFIFVKIIPSQSPVGLWGGDLLKRLLNVLFLTSQNFATSKFSQRQSNGRCLWMCKNESAACAVDYVCILAWALRCLFRLNGQCEGLVAWNK